jgi:ABC-type branched-subunit amino acid transport system substrate-binding protein
MVGSVGNTHQAYYKYLIEKNVPDVFTNDGASFYTDPMNNVVFPASYSFVDEGGALGNYIVKHHPGKKICFMITESVQGHEIPKGVQQVLEKYNKSASAKDKIVIGPTEVVDKTAIQGDSEVARLKGEKCDAVLSTGQASLSAAFVNYGAHHDFKPKWYFYRFAATDKLISLIDENMREGLITNSPVATGESTGVSGWADFKKLMEKNNVPVNGLSAMGYYIAEMFVESLRRATKEHGKDLTRAKYIKTVQSFKDWKCSVCFEPVHLTSQKHWPLAPTLFAVKNNQFVVAE